MSEFKASNGWRIDKAGNVCTPSGVVVITGGESEHVAKFFQELRDHELGRWRDPENPDYVVYPDKEGCFIDQPAVRVVNEKTGGVGYVSRSGACSSSGVAADDRGIWEAGGHYFEAHPQHKPLPTTPGLYVHRGTSLRSARVLRLSSRGDWTDVSTIGGWIKGPLESAQEWHAAGELVRLVPEGSDDE